jgi:hypothetical protein
LLCELLANVIATKPRQGPHGTFLSRFRQNATALGREFRSSEHDALAATVMERLEDRCRGLLPGQYEAAATLPW